MSKKIKIRIKDNMPVLPGTSAWVLQQIENSTFLVATTKDGKPAIWLKFGDKSQLLAIQTTNYKNVVIIDNYPFEDDYVTDTVHEVMGTILTKGGQKVLRQLSKKAATLLRWRLRKGDRATSKMKLKLLPE
jgi:PHD/YefM family antitoxin component YafN of YafNO toxin-antitoxin module